MSPVETVINIVDALVFYAGGMVIFAVTKGYKVVGSIVDGTWSWIEKKTDDGTPDTTALEAIIGKVNELVDYAKEQSARLDKLEGDQDEP